MKRPILPHLILVTAITVIVWLPNPLFAHREGLGDHVLEAYRIDEGVPPHIDGKLDDVAWQHAKPISGFIQLVPERGTPATDDTTVYVVYDQHNLYLAFRCYDAVPDKIVNRMTRRERVYESDVISFFIDPHHDHRTGYKFATTPGGVQNDDYRYEDTRRDTNWQGIWWVETQIDELGWTAEFKIPFANFRFKAKEEQVWGFDIERISRRKNEVTVWKQMTQAGPVTRMSDLAHLVGFRDIRAGKQFEISPYLLSGGTEQQDESRRGQLGVGLDVQYSVQSALKTNITVNPDFAQVEADQLEINLTRFPTRFPERRPFFVEGNSFFETPLDLFFSRRIGSSGNILWGGKVTGKVGDYSLGMLGSQTGSTGLLELGQQSELKEQAWYSAVRLKRDIFRRSNIGMLFTNKEQADGYSRVGGVDMNLAFQKTYHLSGQLAQSFHPGEDTRNRAYTLALAQRNYLWNATAEMERIEPLFETNQTGFLRKEEFRGWQEANFRVTYQPQLRKRLSGFAGVSGGVSQSLYTDAYFADWSKKNPKRTLSPEFDKGLISWGGHIRAGFDFTESFWDGVGVYYRRSREVELTEVFTSSGYGFSVDTNSTKPIAAGIGGDMGNFFNFDRQSIGKQRGVSLMSTVRPQSNFTITFDGSYAQSLDEQRIIDGRFFVSSLRVTYLFSRDSFLRVFTQAGQERTSFNQNIQIGENYLVSALFGWEYKPKSHIFIAYNEGWETYAGQLQLANRVVVLKISYLSNL
jgi:hypothetical protein